MYYTEQMFNFKSSTPSEGGREPQTRLAAKVAQKKILPPAQVFAPTP
jgi:hypothetical protein